VTNPPEVSPETAAAQHIMQLSTGYIASTCIYVAVKLLMPGGRERTEQEFRDLLRTIRFRTHPYRADEVAAECH
jgi:hypothetical protein